MTGRGEIKNIFDMVAPSYLLLKEDKTVLRLRDNDCGCPSEIYLQQIAVASVKNRISREW